MISVVNYGYKAVPVFLSHVSQRSGSHTRDVDMTVALSPPPTWPRMANCCAEILIMILYFPN